MAEQKVVLAAGVVAWRAGPSAAEVLLVHRPTYDDWTLPKGKREPGEHMLLNATREVLEETGAQITLGRRLRGTRYPFRDGLKEVDYWAARVTGLHSDAVPNAEIDQMQWMPVQDAVDLASYDNDMSVLRDFDRKPLDTVPLIVVRHASAGSKQNWPGADLDRPLDPGGAQDAEVLAGLLACFAPGPARVLSSPALRCVDSVRPYATLTAAQVEVNDSLSRTGSAHLHTTLIHDVVAAAKPAVLCLHGENVPGIVGEACVVLGADAPRDMSLPKAGFWVLNVASGSLASIDRYEP